MTDQATEPVVRDTLYIDGAWVASSSGETIDVVNPATEQVMGRVPSASAEDVDRAVRAAAAAFPAWAATPPAERAKYCTAISDGLKARAEELAALISRELGMPVDGSRRIQVGGPVRTFASMAEVVEGVEFEQALGSSLIIREPIGVVGAITPWNYPLHQIAAKVAPAMAAGCTVVLKPSEVTPFNAYVLAEVMDEVGVPAGVFNLVPGLGPVTGEAIATHKLVDMVSFTGSTVAGRRVSELAAQTVKPTALELGGKSPNVILDDVENLEEVVAQGVAACYSNSGQTCTALTRMVVPRSRLAEVERIAAAAAERFTVGDPFAADTKLGPLVSDRQLDRVRNYIQVGLDEGARLVTGGAEAPEGPEQGYYVRPTVFSDVKSDMRIAQEEIFGPVLAILPYEDEADAIRIANDSDYGLAGAVTSADPARANRVARQIRTGMIRVNQGAPNPLAPFGGVKQSGHGREYGPFGIEEFLTIKSMQL